MKQVKILAVLLLVCGLVQNSQAYAVTSAGPASATVKTFYSQLTDVMKQGDKLGFNGRVKKLEPAVKTAFNLPVMTKYAVGFVWSKATPAEQHQLISAFSDFSVANYASRFARYDGEQFEVLGEKPLQSGGIVVETKLSPKEGEPVTLNYLVKQDEQGHYRIVDVFLDGSISELATRRAEFSSIVKSEGIPALVNSLGEKSKQMGPS